MKRLCVFCGSRTGSDGLYASAAQQLGTEMARRGIELIYGGGNVGLMGVIADAVLDAGGMVTGVIPEALAAKELAHGQIQDLRVVSSMHERKALMAELADGFVAMPGGLGTLEEFFEVLTWGQLGFHGKPVALFNVGGYFDGLLAFIDHAVTHQFIRSEHGRMVIAESTVGNLFERMAAYRSPAVSKWLERETL
jgi:uncharacterized protein (TIGR00730 family)